MFFLPTLVKAGHLVFENHQHEFVLNSNNVEINEPHNDCPICEFQFTQLINSESYYETSHQSIISDFIPFFETPFYKKSLLFSFNLRAPPISLF